MRRDKARSRSRTLIALLALFAILCGIVLVIAGPSGTAGSGEAHHARQLTLRLMSTLDRVQEAEQSMSGADFGRARKQLAHARRQLSQLVADINGASRTRGDETDR